MISRTRLALPATVGDLHGAVVGYGLAHLRALVEELVGYRDL